MKAANRRKPYGQDKERKAARGLIKRKKVRKRHPLWRAEDGCQWAVMHVKDRE